MYQLNKTPTFREGLLKSYSGIASVITTLIAVMPILALLSLVLGIAVAALCRIFMFGFNLF